MHTTHRIAAALYLVAFSLSGCSDDPAGSTNNNDQPFTQPTWSSAFIQSASVSGPVGAVGFFGGDLFVGGRFTTAGSVDAMGSARYANGAWQKFQDFDISSTFMEFGEMQGKLYIGGRLSMPGQNDYRGMYQWDGTDLWNVGALSSAFPVDIDFGSNRIYVTEDIDIQAITPELDWENFKMPSAHFAGAIGHMGGTVYASMYSPANLNLPKHSVYKWNGSLWEKMAGVFSSAGAAAPITRIVAAGNTLYAAGAFTTVDGASIASAGVAKWDGSKWTSVGTAAIGAVHDLAVDGSGNLFAATTGALWVWNRATWTKIATTTGGTRNDGRIASVAVSGNRIAIGGDFTNINGTASHNVALTQ